MDVKLALQELKEESDSGRLAGPVSPALPRRTWHKAAAGLAIMVLLAVAAVTLISRLRHEPAPSFVLTKLTSDAGLTTEPSISPDGKLIAYASDRAGEGNFDVWVQQVDSGQSIRLTRHPADDHEPAFSPDGTRIVFRSERDGGGVYVVSTLGGEEKLIVRQGRRPRFSPDGAEIAYWVGNIAGDPTAPGTAQIHVVASAGGRPRQSQPEFAAARYPNWSRDGKHILFWGCRDASARQATADWWVAPLEGGAASRTGVAIVLGEHKLEAPLASYVVAPTEWSALGNRVLFSAQLGDSTNLWSIPLARDWTPAGAPERLTSGSSVETQPAAAPDGSLVFASLQFNVDIWALPVETDLARVTGAPRQLTTGPAPGRSPFVSANGKAIVFSSRRAGVSEVRVKQLETGKETVVAVTPEFSAFPMISTDGSKVAYRAGTQLFLADVAGGAPPEKLVENAGAAWSFTADGKHLLYHEPDFAIGFVLELSSGRSTQILGSAQYSSYRVRVSPDNRWIAFHARNRPGRSAMFAAPFRGATPIAERDWIAVTDGEHYDAAAAWAPGGGSLYFLSERDGYRCIWARRLEPATKHPSGAPFAVQHFHSAARSMLNLPTNWLELSAAPGKLVFNLAEFSGKVWMAKPDRRRALR